MSKSPLTAAEAREAYASSVRDLGVEVTPEEETQPGARHGRTEKVFDTRKQAEKYGRRQARRYGWKLVRIEDLVFGWTPVWRIEQEVKA